MTKQDVGNMFNALGIVLNRLAVSYDESTLAAVGIVLKVERLPQNVGLGVSTRAWSWRPTQRVP
jgi:hypothetical protein